MAAAIRASLSIPFWSETTAVSRFEERRQPRRRTVSAVVRLDAEQHDVDRPDLEPVIGRPGRVPLRALRRGWRSGHGRRMAARWAPRATRVTSAPPLGEAGAVVRADPAGTKDDEPHDAGRPRRRTEAFRPARRPRRRTPRRRGTRREPVAALAPGQLVEERGDDPAPDAPIGWPSATAPPLTFFPSEPEPAAVGEGLGGEGLVDLDEIERPIGISSRRGAAGRLRSGPGTATSARPRPARSRRAGRAASARGARRCARWRRSSRRRRR